MENFINPIQVFQNDPENSHYLLLASIVDGGGDVSISEWKEFDTRHDLYHYIKENLESDSDIIDINESYVIMDSEVYSFSNKTTVSAWMIVVSSIYGDDFNPNHFSIER